MSQADKAKTAIDKIRTSVNGAAEVSVNSLSNDGISDKQAERIYTQFCEDQVESICRELPKDKAIQILLEQVSEVSGLQGKQLADHVAEQFTAIGDMPADQRNFSSSMSEMFKGGEEPNFFDQSVIHPGGDAPAKATNQRDRFTEGEKLLVLQGQITKLKRELVMQQNEIKIFTEELQEGKIKLEQQLKSQMELFRKNSEKALDAERFGQITRGLHISTTVEEKFEEVNATYSSQKEITLLVKIDADTILTNGPDQTIDVLSTKDLKVLHNLNTEGEMAFSACLIKNLLFVGCNKGHVFIYDISQDFNKTNHIQLEKKEKVSYMKILALSDDAQTKHLICCQDTGLVDIIKADDKQPDVITHGHHNTLGMIYKIEKLPTTASDKKYLFAVASNNGVGILSIVKESEKKKQLEQKLESEKYLTGKVVNNLIVSRNHILAFQHDSTVFSLIGRDKKTTQDISWPLEKKTCITGAAMTPDFHADENSFIFVKDESSIKLINTQTWLVSELVDVGEGMKWPDLQLFEVMQEGDNQISLFTVKGKTNSKLVKRTYSHLLKYCMQTASIKASAAANDPERGTKTLNEAQRAQKANAAPIARQTTLMGKIMS